MMAIGKGMDREGQVKSPKHTKQNQPNTERERKMVDMTT